MSKRISIVKALAEKLKTIDGTAPYTTNLYNHLLEHDPDCPRL